MDENKIVDMYLARDEKALELTAQTYGRTLKSIAYNIVKDFEVAEECENDTYLAAWNSIPPNEPRGYLFAYLARITRNLALDICRKSTRIKRSAFICSLSDEIAQCIPAPTGELNNIDGVLLRDAINKFLATIDKDKRNIFVRRYWFLDSVADIARYYGLSQGNVKITLFRIRNKLKDFLEKEGYKL